MADGLQLRFGIESQAINNFDGAWQSWSSIGGTGEPPDLAAFFPAAPPARVFVIELVKVDLDFRWRYAERIANAVKLVDTYDRSSDSSDLKPAAAAEGAVRLPHRPRLEDYVARFPVLGALNSLPMELIELEFAKRHAYGDQPSVAEFTARFPAHGEPLGAALRRLADHLPARKAVAAPREEAIPGPADDAATEAAQRLAGRYRKVRQLGQGAFGTVWLAEHLELGKLVAFKEPRADRFGSDAEIEAYLHEARVLASLDHPHIVPVYDAGRTADGACYVVSKYIDGMDLAAYLKQKPLTFAQTAELLSCVADALQQTHNRGLVHRDIKPANILIDSLGRPFVADFGLALRDEDFGKQRNPAGTPAYMSPEQARHEGHLIDGRSDIFSLGVVLYELLTGVRPFPGESVGEVLERIKADEPKPPRQRNDAIPKELERICLKALSKRVADRHSCAADFAEALRAWARAPVSTEPKTGAVKIVPKGLRSFDAADSDFFLALLEGPRDQYGLPDSLRFWKTRIEEIDPTKTFRVGLLYGPSGCGKSSLMKAGLLPRLAQHVVRIYLECTPDDTEKTLLAKLRQACGDLPRDTPLAETMEALRRGKGLASGRKVLLVLDQFEQWLYARSDSQGEELVNALRQCDGQRLQSLLLVRDEFYLAADRMARRVEVALRGGENQALLDLFDPPHARKLLAEFGVAYERLPTQDGPLSPTQEEFLSQAVSGLAQEDGKVICVRLALFVDMMKGHDWTPKTLAEIGGASGVGVNFLERNFGDKLAPAKHRPHQTAARSALRALLPATGSEIKGHRRSASQLRDAAKYSSHPAAFAELIEILDQELRLITPVSSDGQEPAYQLTHDYLVPSIRKWLARKQRETRRGRAELLLEERAATWAAKPENRQLPSLGEYLRIATLTPQRERTEPQQRMMRRAGFFHVLRTALAVILVTLLGSAAFTAREWQRIGGLVTSLLSANPDQMLEIAEQLDRSPRFSDAHLKPLFPSTDATKTSPSNVAATDPQKLLHARLALVARSAHEAAVLEVLYTGKFTYAVPIRERLRLLPATRFKAVQDKLKTVLGDERADARRRFGAALALSAYVPATDNVFWKASDLTFVTGELLSANPEYQPELRRALRPIEQRLRQDLERFFSDAQSTDAQRLAAANAFADYAPKEAAKLAELLTVATPAQYSVLYPLVESGRTDGIIKELGRIAARPPSDDMGSLERVAFGQRRANAAATLLRLGEREAALPVFLMKDDPEALTQFIFRCRPRGVGVEALLDCLEIVSSSPPGRYAKEARYALLLSLAEFRLSEVPEVRRPAVLQQVRAWYATDPSSGVHGGANWLLRQWGEQAYVKQVDETPMAPSVDREWFTLAIKVKPEAPSTLKDNSLASKPPPATTFYYTFVVFHDDEYPIGSPDDEQPKREKDEVLHRVRLTRSFALMNREVTFAELIAFNRGYEKIMGEVSQRPESTGVGVSWYDAVQFSRWLGTQHGLSEADQAYADPDSPMSGERKPNSVASWAPRNWPLDPSRRGFRLASEAEWEIASRGGVRTSYGFGSDVGLLDGYGWFHGNSGGRVHSPRERRPGHRGLFDMHGNASEWVHDWYGDYGGTLGADPLGAIGGSSRVNRGGCWSLDAAYCRAAFRYGLDPSLRGSFVGFRLALSFVGVPAESGQDKNK